MPFVSKAQRRKLQILNPALAQRWERETPDPESLPERAKRSSFEWAETGPGERLPHPNIRFQKISGGDIDDLELGDPRALMPALRSIHKMGQLKTAAGALPPTDVAVQHALWDRLIEEGLEQGEDQELPVDPYSMLPEALPPGLPGKLMAASANSRVRDINRELLQRELQEGRGLKIGLERAKLGQDHRLQGQLQFQGLPIAVENRAGSVRKGVDKDGQPWRTEMHYPYGYIRGTEGADGEGVDVFVGPDRQAPSAYVVHQRDPETGKYDEDKVMLGFDSKNEAQEAFLDHYDDPKFLGPIAEVSMERLKQMVEERPRLHKIARASYVALLDELRQPQLEKTAILGAGIGALAGWNAGKLIEKIKTNPAALAVAAGLGAAGGSFAERMGEEAANRLISRLSKPKIKKAEAEELPEGRFTRGWRLARKLGPAGGAALGAAVALMGKSGTPAQRLRRVIAGLGTGATIGWLPDIAASAREGLAAYRSGR